MLLEFLVLILEENIFPCGCSFFASLTFKNSLAQLSWSGVLVFMLKMVLLHRSLLIASFVPFYLWREVVSVVIYFINHQSSFKLARNCSVRLFLFYLLTNITFGFLVAHVMSCLCLTNELRLWCDICWELPFLLENSLNY